MIESDATLANGTEAPVQGATAETLAGDVNVTLTPLQRIVEEILEPLAVGRRTVKEWRSLYRAFFAFFAPEGGADEAERSAWKTAADVFQHESGPFTNESTIPNSPPNAGADHLAWRGLRGSRRRRLGKAPALWLEMKRRAQALAKDLRVLPGSTLGKAVVGDELARLVAGRQPLTQEARVVRFKCPH